MLLVEGNKVEPYCSICIVSLALWHRKSANSSSFTFTAFRGGYFLQVYKKQFHLLWVDYCFSVIVIQRVCFLFRLGNVSLLPVPLWMIFTLGARTLLFYSLVPWFCYFGLWQMVEANLIKCKLWSWLIMTFCVIHIRCVFQQELSQKEFRVPGQSPSRGETLGRGL